MSVEGEATAGVNRIDGGADLDGPSLGEIDGEATIEPSPTTTTVSTNDGDAAVHMDASVTVSDAGPELVDAASINSDAGPELVDATVVGLPDDDATDGAVTNDTSWSDPVANDAATGDFPVENSCATANGGCDLLATCVDGDSLTCGPCPEGYSGSGQSGCVPMLLGLAVAEGTLSPAFESEQSQYALALGLFAETVALSAEAPAGATLSIGGQDMGTAASWTSPPLSMGENVIQIDLLRDEQVVNSYLLTVTRHDQIDFLKATKAHPSGVFGWDVALSADRRTLAIGTPGDPSVSQGMGGDPNNDDAPGTGAVYVFTRNAAGWVNEAYLKASNAAEGDSFGRSVALSADGNTLVVGAVGEDSDAFVVGGDGENDDASEAGAAYVFRRAGGEWIEEEYLKASNCGVGDLFGADVAIAANGDLIAVSAPLEDSADSGVGAIEDNDDALSSGAVYLFGHDNGLWSQAAYVKASNSGAGDAFGTAIDLERISKPQREGNHEAKRDDGTGKVAELGVVKSLALPPNEQPPELIVPGVRSLNDPTARFSANAPNERLLTATTNVRLNLATTHGALDVRVVVTLVETQVLWPTRAACSAQGDRVKHRSHQPFVVHVRCGNLQRNRHAPAIGQNMPFRAAFRTIGRVGTRMVPPFGAFTMALSRLVQSRPTPTAESYSRRRIRHSVRNSPCSLHSAKRRWQVAPEPNSLPSAFHGQPVRSLYNTPAMTLLAGTVGLPPAGFLLSGGSNGSMRRHNSSGRS